MSYQEKITNEEAETIEICYSRTDENALELCKECGFCPNEGGGIIFDPGMLASDLLHAREERDKAVAMVREALELLKSHLADNPKQSELYCYCGLCKDTRAFLEKAREYAEE